MYPLSPFTFLLLLSGFATRNSNVYLSRLYYFSKSKVFCTFLAISKTKISKIPWGNILPDPKEAHMPLLPPPPPSPTRVSPSPCRQWRVQRNGHGLGWQEAKDRQTDRDRKTDIDSNLNVISQCAVHISQWIPSGSRFNMGSIWPDNHVHSFSKGRGSCQCLFSFCFRSWKV